MSTDRPSSRCCLRGRWHRNAPPASLAASFKRWVRRKRWFRATLFEMLAGAPPQAGARIAGSAISIPRWTAIVDGLLVTDPAAARSRRRRFGRRARTNRRTGKGLGI